MTATEASPDTVSDTSTVVSGSEDDADYDYSDDEDYGDYGDYPDYGPPKPSLPFSFFDQTVAKKKDPEEEKQKKEPSACTWAVVNCCSIADHRGHRIACFDRMGCPGSWFEDLCTPAIRMEVFKEVFGVIRG